MNIKYLHTWEKPVSSIPLLKCKQGNTIAIQILKGETLEEHMSITGSYLICIERKAIFESEKGIKEPLFQFDFVSIKPIFMHRVKSIKDSQLKLIQ